MLAGLSKRRRSHERKKHRNKRAGGESKQVKNNLRGSGEGGEARQPTGKKHSNKVSQNTLFAAILMPNPHFKHPFSLAETPKKLLRRFVHQPIKLQMPAFLFPYYIFTTNYNNWMFIFLE